MAADYYLMSGNQKVGPLTEAQILREIKAGRLSLFDTIYNHQSGEWVMLMQHPDFCDVELDSRSQEEASSDSDELSLGVNIGLSTQEFRVDGSLGSELLPTLQPLYWYERTKPNQALKFLDVVSMVHAKKYSEQTLLAQSPQGPWKALVEWSDFSPESLRTYQNNTQVQLPEVSIRRKSPRYPCGKIFIFSIRGKVFKAFCPDISKSGISFVVKVPRADINDEAFVKFSETLDNNNFDMKARVVGVSRIRAREASEIYIRYALRFTHMTEVGKQIVSEMISSVTPNS